MSIKVKFVVFACVFVGLSLFNLIAINYWIHHAEDSAATVNVAGRQRMLSQKITKELLLVKQNIPRQQDLKQSIQLFETSLKALENGSKSLGVSAPPTTAINNQLKKVDTLWFEFKALATMPAAELSPAEITLISEKSMTLLKETNAAVSLYEASANQSIDTLYLLAMVSFLITTLLAISGIVYLQRSVFSRMDRIQQVSQRISGERDLTLRIGLDGSDEIDRTAQSFDSLLTGFAQFSREVQDLELALKTELETVKKVAVENRQQVKSQRDSILQVAQSVDELSRTSAEIGRNTNNSVDLAKNVNNEISNGKAQLDTSVKLIDALEEDLKNSGATIDKLSSASESIGGIADTIATIADQTNLLALNAAIEAARAGEQGRGFAVVADEVRTLAQRTQKATSEIHNLIISLQETTQQSVQTIINSREHSEKNVEESRKLSEVLSRMSAAFGQLNDLSSQTAFATEQQSGSVVSINENISEIDDTAEGTLNNADKVAKSVEHLNVMATQLHESLLRYRY